MAEQEAQGECLEYARWMVARVRRLTRDTLRQAEGARVLALPTVLNTKKMREMEVKIEAAIVNGEMGVLVRLCLEYEDGMRAHCEWIVGEAAQERAAAAAGAKGAAG